MALVERSLPRTTKSLADALIVVAASAVAAGVVAFASLKEARGSRPPGSGPRLPDAPPQIPLPQAEARGKTAESPARISARGWKEVALRVYAEFLNDRVLAVAAGVTFYALLAIFPAIVALVSLYGLIADLSTLDGQLAMLRGVVPDQGLGILREQVARIVTKDGGTLGFAFAFGLLVALWSANAGVKAMFDALNVVYDEKEKRSFIKLNLVSLAFTIGGIGFILLAFNGVVVLPVVLSWVWLGDVAESLLQYGRWPLLLLAMIIGLSLLYRFGPSRRRPKWRWVTPGSIVASLLWLAGSAAFSVYASNFAHYEATYGSLGAAIGFMTWIWMSAVVVLIGGELNSELEHQTVADSTTGHPRPLGARGATMADTVAP